MMRDGRGGRDRWDDREGQRCQVFLEALVLPVRIGIYEEEKHASQPVSFDIDMACRVRLADDGMEGATDIIDYDDYANRLADFLADKPHTGLLEQLVAEIAAWSFERLGALESIRIRAHKPKVRRLAERMGVALYWTRLDHAQWLARSRARMHAADRTVAHVDSATDQATAHATIQAAP